MGHLPQAVAHQLARHRLDGVGITFRQPHLRHRAPPCSQREHRPNRRRRNRFVNSATTHPARCPAPLHTASIETVRKPARDRHISLKTRYFIRFAVAPIVPGRAATGRQQDPGKGAASAPGYAAIEPAPKRPTGSAVSTPEDFGVQARRRMAAARGRTIAAFVAAKRRRCRHAAQALP